MQQAAAIVSLFQASSNSLPSMDPKQVIAMALEAILKTKREGLRVMKESIMADKAKLEEKQRELSRLEEKKQQLLANEAAIGDLFELFMVFIEATENNDLETAQNFDEEAMLNVIGTMLNSYAGDDNGGISGDYGDAHFGEGFSDDTGGSAVNSGGPNIQPEDAQSTDHKQADSDGSDGSGESDGSCDGYRRRK